MPPTTFTRHREPDRKLGQGCCFPIESASPIRAGCTRSGRAARAAASFAARRHLCEIRIAARTLSGRLFKGQESEGPLLDQVPTGVEFGGGVGCLSASAHTAGLTGRIDRVKVADIGLGSVEGNYLWIRITDNGEPGTLDLVTFARAARCRRAAALGSGTWPSARATTSCTTICSIVRPRPAAGPVRGCGGRPYGTG